LLHAVGAALLAAALIPAPASLAQTGAPDAAVPLPPGPKPEPGVQVERDGVKVRVTKAQCLRLVKHVPAPDATYQPGVDVRGDPVAGAHLYGRPRLSLPERVRIPIEVDLGARYGLPGDDSWKGDVQVGTVEVDLDTGQARFNGQPLTAPDQARIRAACQRVLRQR
jgi:hypothetical protein